MLCKKYITNLFGFTLMIALCLRVALLASILSIGIILPVSSMVCREKISSLWLISFISFWLG